MSDRGRGAVGRALVLAGALIALTSPGVVRAARAQDLDALRRELDIASAREVQAQRNVDSLRRDRTAVLNDSVKASGRLVRFNANALPTNDRARLLEALDSAARSLEARFGASAPSLMDSLPWELRSSRVRMGSARVLEMFAPTIDGRRLGVAFRLPMPMDDITALALGAAGAKAATGHPTLERFARTMSLETTDGRYVRAALNMALSNSAVGRRCAAGAIGACRTVLSPPDGPSPLSVWYARGDYRSIVAASQPTRARRDSAGVRSREACLRNGDDAECERIVSEMQLTYPFHENVRGTFAAHAVETGGAAGLERLRAARDRYVDDPIGLLAHVSGETEDDLIKAWQRRLHAAAVADSQPPVVPLAISAAFWCALLLLGASRRRPR